ncbi:MAG: asparagine synthase (glutamine-hydrolyzing) [Pseudomonadota bacterium]
MCGIAGFFWQSDQAAGSGAQEETLVRIDAMTAALHHRGPDSGGTWADARAGIALGHRRLAIVDLSPAGHQPMASVSGRYWLTYNGEIYNHSALRRRLEAQGRAPTWAGTSDTETLLAAIKAWGLDTALSRAVGMFALALWDSAERRLFLARDRLGEKPLYYGWQGEGATARFLFGSELKALTAHPACERRIRSAAIAQLMRHSYVGAEHCIYEGLAKVPPGGIVSLSAERPEPVVRRYWSAAEVAATTPRIEVSPEEAVDQLEALLLEAVEGQMMSDVPLGAFLSGGIDSATITALMQRLSDRPVRSFSIGFHSKRYNEAEHAKAVAAHLGTDHTELYVGDEELRAVVPRLPTMYDEPFADSSQIPTHLVAAMAREHVTVALSGDGGDELFAGYDRYRQFDRFARQMHRIPRGLRGLGARAVRTLPPRLLDRVLGRLQPVAEGKEPHAQRLARLADYAASRDVTALHRALVSRARTPLALVPGVEEPEDSLLAPDPRLEALAPPERMMALDTGAYLPDDILAKVDRATMACALESRAPFLDHRVVEFAWSLPLDLKLRGGIQKWALRQVLYRHVPQALVDRPKMGFEVPVATWLRGPLRDWAEALIAPERLAREGFLDPTEVHRLWDAHQSGREVWAMQLWNVLMFQAWLEAETADRARAQAA